MKNVTLQLKIFFKYHIDRRLLCVSILFFAITVLYYFVFLNINEIFNGAHKVGIMLNNISISIISSYVFYFMVFELPGFKDKIKVYMTFFKKKATIQFVIKRLLDRLQIDEQNWNKLEYDQRNKLIQTVLENEISLKYALKLVSVEINHDIKDEIISNEIQLLAKEFSQIQTEFNNITIHSKYLNSRLLFLIITIQEYRIFDSTLFLRNLNNSVQINTWDYDIFLLEYTSLLDDLIKCCQVLSEEIDPYWNLIKEKNIDDFLSN